MPWIHAPFSVSGIVRGYGGDRERSDDAAGFETLRGREACLGWKMEGNVEMVVVGGLILFAFVFGAAALLSFSFSFALPPAAVAFLFKPRCSL